VDISGGIFMDGKSFTVENLVTAVEEINKKPVEHLVVCSLCNHSWFTKLDRPSECPRCKRYDWDKEK
jgi:predicted Zn-ribbon and HTH transcriptional regulator